MRKYIVFLLLLAALSCIAQDKTIGLDTTGGKIRLVYSVQVKEEVLDRAEVLDRRAILVARRDALNLQIAQMDTVLSKLPGGFMRPANRSAAPLPLQPQPKPQKKRKRSRG